MQMTNAFGAYLAMPGADLLHHLQIDAEQIVAAHTRLARNARGDDAHVGAVQRVVGIGSDVARVKALDRR